MVRGDLEGAHDGCCTCSLCNWSIPVITAMVVSVLTVVSIVLYFLNFRYILFVVGKCVAGRQGGCRSSCLPRVGL